MAKSLKTSEKPRAASQEEILKWLPLVEKVAAVRRQALPRNCDFDREDLVSAGVIGLHGAIESFDPTRGVKFASYASHRIHGAILDYIRNCDWVPRVERAKRKHECHRQISVSQMSPCVNEMIQSRPAAGTMPHHAMQQREERAEMLRGLTRREKTIMSLRFFEGLSMKEIGRSVGISECRVSQIIARCLVTLREKHSSQPALAA